MTAVEALDDALLQMVEHGQRPPCTGLPGFISDDPAERAMAARICQSCPLVELCAAAADERKEPHGVWGGVDRCSLAYRRKETA